MMARLAITAVLAAACATPDDRPRTIEYVTEAILAPNCGNAQCHSSFRQSGNFALDSVEATRYELVGLAGPITVKTAYGDGQFDFEGDPENTMLIDVLTRAVDRMPYDQPLPKADIDFLRRYIRLGAPGAQCIPAQGPVCVGKRLFTCGEDSNYSGLLEDCASRTPTDPLKTVWECVIGECRERCTVARELCPPGL